jgi:NADH:ubiquinone oxidoreductase subunit 4 (subunit M)
MIPGYKRFFSYISLFTFSMLMLVMSNNFMQLFFGWEAVGLVSYLLIGFWYTRPTAIFANLKAFLVNRVGDFGFILGIGLVLAHFGTLDYAAVFAKAPANWQRAPRCRVWRRPGRCADDRHLHLLFIGAMGKSAQVPLHVWLPDSMEGPTPISALIHAATMVTAGIFMVARMSPLFELSDTALSFVIVIGAITALFMGFLGIIQNDIKRVVAYSTLSQLGYMTVALGASAYSVAIFHLMTHAFFKALLFLGRRLGDHRHAPRSGHSQHGWPAQVHADHLDHLADRFPGADRNARSLPASIPRTRSSRRLPCRISRAPDLPTLQSWRVFSSPPSTRSGCISWCFTARSASASRPHHDPHARARQTRAAGGTC